jgi:hypothetical protein
LTKINFHDTIKYSTRKGEVMKKFDLLNASHIVNIFLKKEGFWDWWNKLPSGDRASIMNDILDYLRTNKPKIEYKTISTLDEKNNGN